MINRIDDGLSTFGVRPDLIAMTDQGGAFVRAVLPGSPLSQNQIYRIVTIKPRGKEAHATLTMTTEGKDYLWALRDLLNPLRPASWDRGNAVDVEAVYYFDTLIPDVDGPGKLVLDALGADRPRKGGSIPAVYPDGVLVRNDRQVRDFLQRRRLDRDHPRLELLVVSIPPAQRGFL